MNLNKEIALSFNKLFSDQIDPKQIELLLIRLSELLNINTFQFNSDKQQQAITVGKGMAVSTGLAAHCFNDYLRTYCFMKGTYLAIRDKLENNSQSPLNILYAGTGPFCTIILPLLFLFTPADLSITSIEINEDSFLFSKKYLKSLGKEHFFKSMHCADALGFHSDEHFDVIISETMDKALSREPQMAIFSHLIQFLKTDGLLIPQTIKIDLVASSVLLEKTVDYDCHTDTNTRKINWEHRQFITTLIEANRAFFNKHELHEKEKIFLAEFQTTNIKENLNELYLLTEVQIYKDVKLIEDDSWLTKQYIAFSISNKSRGKVFTAFYINSHTPHIELVPLF